MPTVDQGLLDKLDATVSAAHAAFNACPIGDPYKTELAVQRSAADAAYLDAINNGLSGNSAALTQAAQGLDDANKEVQAALDSAKKTAEVFAALQKAVGFAIQLAHLGAAVAAL